jgi:hypothetical protein
VERAWVRERKSGRRKRIRITKLVSWGKREVNG